MQTLAIILPYLQYVAGAGAGWLASIVFGWLRERYAGHTARGSLLDTALYSPFWARFTSWGISVLFALPAAVCVALIQGQDVLVSVDEAFAVALGVLFSQIRHAWVALPVEPATGRTDGH